MMFSAVLAATALAAAAPDVSAAQRQQSSPPGVGFLEGGADGDRAAAGRRHRRHRAELAERRAWARRAVAASAAEAAEAKDFEKRIFEQGRKLRERKAEYLRRLRVFCKQGDAECR